MPAVNVLITSASRKVSLVQAFKNAVSKRGGIVVAVDINPRSPALYFADRHEISPRSDDPRFIDFLKETCKRYAIHLVIPTRDEELPLFARHKEELAKDGVVVMVTSEETVRTCQDKRRFHEFCVARGFGVPRSIDIGDPEKKYPLFLKPRIGKGGKGAFKVTSEVDIQRAVKGLEHDVMLEEFVDWQEYTIDLFATFKGDVISVVPRSRDVVVSGESYVSTTVDNDKLTSEAIKLSRELGLIGHNTLQVFKNDRDDIKFIEVNPRFGGAAHLGFEAGAPTPDFLVSLIEGKEVLPVIGQYKKGLVMLRYTQDLFIDGAHLP